MDLQPVLTAGVLATAWSLLIYVIVRQWPDLLVRPRFGLTLKTELFLGMWIGAAPIGFALGTLIPATLFQTPATAYLAILVNAAGIATGPVLGWIVLRSLPVKPS